MDAKDDRIKRLKDRWYSRNPAHEINLDSGRDMYWDTLLMVIDEFIEPEKEEYAKQHMSAIWNFEGLPKEDKPVLIFREKHVPEVIGAFYEGNVEYGEFHNGEECPERIVYSDVTGWADVLEAPKLATGK